MILADTSVWIDHFRKENLALAQLMHARQLYIHPWIIGELACGNLPQREIVLRFLHNLPQAAVMRDRDVLAFIERNRAWGAGVRYVDMHLIASAFVENLSLWTRDRRLSELAARMGREAKLGADGFVI